MKKIFLALTAVIAIGIAVPGSAFAADTTVVVTPSALNGWTVAPDGTVPWAFDNRAASLGAGSLGFGPIDGAAGANKFVLYAPYSGLSSDLTGFSYDFYVDPSSPGGAADGQHFYANVYVDDFTNGIGTFGPDAAPGGWYDCRYDSVPAEGEDGGWTTHSMDDTSWTNIADRRDGACPATLGELALGSTVKFIALNGGQSTSSDAGLKGAYDNVVVTTSSDKTTYNFEPANACLTSTSGTTITLLADCTVTNTVTVPSGFTLEGLTSTTKITAQPGGSFDGGIVANENGQPMTVKNLTIVGRNLGVSCGAKLAGIRLVGAGGMIDNVFVNGLHQTENGHVAGCQTGHGIEVDARAVASPVAVTIKDSEIVDYQKTGILVRGDVHATITGNTVDWLRDESARDDFHRVERDPDLVWRERVLSRGTRSRTTTTHLRRTRPLA